jgi:hypothetical protein
MRRALTFCSLVGATIVSGSTLLGQERYLPKRDQTIELLQADAASVPPEFEADILLKLSSLSKVDKEWRRELLDTAFMRAYAAPEQHRRATTQQIPPESRQGAQVFAYATALTRVTLQVRAVELMVFLDPLHARDLFEWIDLNLGPGVCTDPLVPSVDEYYTALGQIARLAYRNHYDALNFFELYLWRAHLPSEMPAVARAIQRYPRSRDEAAYLEGLFRLILLGSTSDPPGFSSAALDITAKMTDLQIDDTGMGVLGSNVMEALRSYILAQFKAPRCADNATAPVLPSTFNAAVRRAKADFDVRPMDADAARLPTTAAGATRIDEYWQTGDARRLHDAAARLRGPGAVAYSLRVRQTPEWRAQADQLLTDVEKCGGASEPAARDFFYQKSVLFIWLIDLIPRGELHTRAVRGFIEFLRRSETDVNRRMLWFAFVNRLLEMTHGPFRAEVLAAMEESHQPVIALYARLERVTPERRP